MKDAYHSLMIYTFLIAVISRKAQKTNQKQIATDTIASDSVVEASSIAIQIDGRSIVSGIDVKKEVKAKNWDFQLLLNACKLEFFCNILYSIDLLKEKSY